ncbi:hypothetical protein RCL_jg18000.t1 [Rhizophagus clarus]|uniref:Uncharacterized protein n=1 Tax=Rhizophagus clarus TaxID=94130 RepID=A0A8H3L472_9GLOM|nr:hypothetical protein RCL_jg18000.t1 [Rhizophagus clarus]
MNTDMRHREDTDAEEEEDKYSSWLPTKTSGWINNSPMNSYVTVSHKSQNNATRLIDERKEGNRHYHSLGGGNCKRPWWTSIAGKINQR